MLPNLVKFIWITPLTQHNTSEVWKQPLLSAGADTELIHNKHKSHCVLEKHPGLYTAKNWSGENEII